MAVDDNYETVRNVPISASVAGNDLLTGEGTHTWKKLTDPANGDVVFNPDGTFTYTPDKNWMGVDVFTYEICDVNGDCDPATVLLTVIFRNEPPEISGTATSTLEDTPVTICLPATDPENDVLTVNICGQPQHGDITTPTYENGQVCFTYTPAPDYSGQDAVCIEVCDQVGNCANATVTITVLPGQDLEISGNVYHDTDLLSDNTVDGTGTNAGGLFANLVNAANQVVACVPVTVSGTYSFTEADGVVANTTYTIILTNTIRSAGTTLTSAVLPAGWVSTGEHWGSGTGSDGTVDSKLSVNTNAGSVTEANFGINSAPDVTPIITAVPNVMHGPTDFYITVRVTELNQVNTNGIITVFIPKDSRWTLNGPFVQNPIVLGTTTMNNNVWSYSQDVNHHIFTTSSVITAGSILYTSDSMPNGMPVKPQVFIRSHLRL